MNSTQSNVGRKVKRFLQHPSTMAWFVVGSFFGLIFATSISLGAFRRDPTSIAIIIGAYIAGMIVWFQLVFGQD